MSRRCVGLIEAIGLAAGISVADAAVKSGNVNLLGYEYSGGDASVVIKVEGNVGAVKAAIAAAKLVVPGINSSIAGLGNVVQKSALDESVYDCMIRNKLTIGDELQVQSGKRPQGTGKTAKWVGHWNPKNCYIYE